MKEEWRAVPGYEGLYEVSNMGRVRSLDRWVEGYKGTPYFKPGTLLTLQKDYKGYCYVVITKNAKGVQKKVHRLVAMAFIPNPDNLPMVNHRDECKTNNNVDNLEWCTAIYNSHWGSAREKCAWNRISVEQYDLEGNYIASYRSISDAAKAVGAAKQNIWSCLYDKRYKTAKGYKWKLKKG